MYALPLVIAAFLVSVLSCAPDRESARGEPVPRYTGMVRIAAASQTCMLGSTDTLARADERPAMQTILSNDFWTDTTEVTVGLWRAVMGGLPREYAALTGTRDDEPVRFVTWYDAAVFCNRRSRIDSLDTVYCFSGLDTAGDGSIYRLRNLTTGWGSNGYRLPTEAEWVFAASPAGAGPFTWGADTSASAARAHAWFSANAGGAVHAVASLAPNRRGLYDMAGNVMEWTNDLRGSLVAGCLTDYAGAPPRSCDERVVKGGGFVHDAQALRIARRGDVYPALSAARNRYTGLRCVAGVKSAPTYLSETGFSSATDSVRALLADIQQVLPTCEAKLVFVNKTATGRFLCLIDFRDPDPHPVQLLDFTPVNRPVISPDGLWVAFCTGSDGVAGPSRVYTRSLRGRSSPLHALPDSTATAPHWWVDTASHDTFLVYATSAMLNTNPAWPAAQTRMWRMSAGVAADAAPRVLDVRGAYTGGRSANGRFLATGFTQLRMAQLDTGYYRVLFTGPGNGKAAGDTSQVCNVSIGPGQRGDQALFLDFGSYGIASSLTGAAYGVHEYLFVANFDNTVLRWYRAPSGAQSWNHPHWSTSPDYAVATAVTAQGEARTVHLVNLANSTYVPLAAGTDLWHPYLWVGSSARFTLSGVSRDSAGRYDDPHVSVVQTFLEAKMQSFWHRRGELELVFLGNSRASNGFSPSSFPGLAGLNMSDGDVGIRTVERMVNCYVLPHCPRLKLVGMSLAFEWFSWPESTMTWPAVHHRSTGVTYDRNHGYWADGLPAGFADLVSPSRYVEQEFFDSLGQEIHQARGWGGANPPVLEGDWSVSNPDYRKNMGTLRELISTLAERRVHLLIVVFPQSPAYRQTPWFGRHGPRWETARTVISEVKTVAASSPYAHFYDAYNFGDHDYGEQDSWDYDHLSPEGAHKLCTRLDSLVRTFLREK